MDRRKRTRLATAKAEASASISTASAVVVVVQPRKKKTNTPEDQLETLLKSPKSGLTTRDMPDIINANSWDMLPEEAKAHLCFMLPPTAFRGYQATVEPHHPSRSGEAHLGSDDLPTASRSPENLDPAVFTDPHFLAAARTFQDHIYSDWMSDSHKEKVRKFQRGVLDGTLNVAWKDEVWEGDHNSAESVPKSTLLSNLISASVSNALAGDAAELKLVDLVENNIILVGDVIAYRRNFSALNVIIEKDAIIQSVHPQTHAITLLLQPGVCQHLPSNLLFPNPPNPSSPTQTLTIISPTSLESGILDADGRIEKSRRPNGNAWKYFTVWRWRGAPPDFTGQDVRGGRENHGTLFYLRGTYYHDR